MDRATAYKLQLACTKVVPILLSMLYLLNIIFNYFDHHITALDYLAGTSLFTILPMYISSYAFRFCKYHRMFIHYILVSNLLDMLDYYVGVPVSDRTLFIMFLFIAVTFSYLALYYHIKYGERKVVTSSCWTSKEGCRGY